MTKKRTDDPNLRIKGEQAKVRREFNFLTTTPHILSTFAETQAKEICGYMNRLSVAPFPAWESFLLSNMQRDTEAFLYKFYLRKNEFGVLEPDEERITELKLQDLAVSS